MNSLNYFSLSPRGRAKSSDSYALPCYTTTRYTVQTGVLKVKQEEADEEDEDVEKSDEEEVEKPPAKAGASAKGAKKRKAAAAVAEEGAAAVAEALSTVVPSVEGSGKRSRVAPARHS